MTFLLWATVAATAIALLIEVGVRLKYTRPIWGRASGKLPDGVTALYAPGFCAKLNANAVTLSGWLVLFADRLPAAAVIRHEAGHVKQGRKLFVFYLPAVLIPLAIMFVILLPIKLNLRAAYKTAYRWSPMELWADRTGKRTSLR